MTRKYCYQKGDVVHYAGILTKDETTTGLIVDVEYHVKPDDFLIFIMWPDAGRPQALFQKDCYHRGLEVLG